MLDYTLDFLGSSGKVDAKPYSFASPVPVYTVTVGDTCLTTLDIAATSPPPPHHPSPLQQLAAGESSADTKGRLLPGLLSIATTASGSGPGSGGPALGTYLASC